MSRRRLLPVVLVAVMSGLFAFLPSRPMIADSRPLPSDLALVPSDAVGFLHIRAADLWNHPDLKPWRGVFEGAGQRSVGLLDLHFAPKPSTTDRVTFVLLPPGKGKPQRRSDFDPFNPTLILHFTEPFDKEQVKKAHAEKAKSKTVAGKELVLAERADVAMAFVDDRTLILGEESGVTAILANTKKDGPLATAIQAAAGTQPIVAGLNVKALPIPPEALVQIPDEFKPLTDLDAVTASIDMTKEPVLQVRATFPNADSATGGEKAMRKLADLARVFLNQHRQELTTELTRHLDGKRKKDAGGAKVHRPLGDFPEAAMMVAGLGGLNFVDDLLAHPPIERKGADLTTSVKLPAWASQFVAGGAVAAGVMMPAVQKVRETAERSKALNNLKQIGIALHSYHDVYGHFPPAATLGKKGKKLYSWRVTILPYIEQSAVYSQFKLDEPWDSESNKKLSDLTIPTYTDPRIALKPAHTVYKVPVGNGAMFDLATGCKILSITDGTSNTIMVLAGGDPVPWAKPEEFEYDPKVEFPADYAKEFDDFLATAFADGSVRVLNLAKLKNRAQTMRHLIERADGNAINIDDN
ncbi:DUF1559 family PulG-like putative transporter [Limnoglobus roseus]|uniref:DUF1559 domain-containing protein n=1 Tax=Limnoglobus roseus TaxID=2598579 RepID=A0A5C1ALI3_9BACT|nr:DUF1559 domain-containing protein [Limnoglobus roseus]QEL20091.1 hypothetical protein PX52LOC_07179 [Limnoglobus roseus]